MKKVFSFIKTRLFALLAALGFVSTACAAEGDFDTSLAEQFLSKANTAVSSFWSANSTTILGILGIIVGLSVLWMIVKIIRKATGKAG